MSVPSPDSGSTFLLNREGKTRKNKYKKEEQIIIIIKSEEQTVDSAGLD